MRKDFAAYHFFASALVSLRPSLKNLKCFGSDVEKMPWNKLSVQPFQMLSMFVAFCIFGAMLSRS